MKKIMLSSAIVASLFASNSNTDLEAKIKSLENQLKELKSQVQSQDARYYSMLVFFQLLALWGILKGFKGQYWGWIIAVMAMGANFFNHQTSAISSLTLCFGAFIGISFLTIKNLINSSGKKRRFLLILISCGIVFIAGLVLILINVPRVERLFEAALSQFKSFNKYLEQSLQNDKDRNYSLSKFKNFPDIDKTGKIKDILKGGQKIIVQIAKEPISTKGPRLGSEISLAGRALVLLPF